MMCCTQAVKIADCLKTIELIKRWKELPWEKQKKKFPQLDEGHSGNTFECSVYLAELYLTSPEKVVLAHGAMVPLVGCKAYGCTH